MQQLIRETNLRLCVWQRQEPSPDLLIQEMKLPFFLLTILAGHCWLPPVGGGLDFLSLWLVVPSKCPSSEQTPGAAGLEKGVCDVPPSGTSRQTELPY